MLYPVNNSRLYLQQSRIFMGRFSTLCLAQLLVVVHLLAMAMAASGSLCSTAGAAEDGDVLQLVDNRLPAARLISVDEQLRAVFQTGGGTPGALRTVTADQLVYWGHPAQIRTGVRIVTADGLWIGIHQPETGFAVEIKEAALHFPSDPDLFGDIRLPLERVYGIVFQPPADRIEHDRLLDRIARAEGAEDRVILVNGDVLTGTVSKLAEDQVHLETELGPQQLSIAREFGEGGGQVTAVIFNPAVREKPLLDEPILCGFSDGSLLRVRALRYSPEKVELTLAGGRKLPAIDPPLAVGEQKLTLLQPLQGTVAYLSDRKPLSYRHVPYLSLAWPYHEDRNVHGGRLRSNGMLYAKGLGMHAPARLAYRLDKPYRRFAAEIALDDSAGRQGSVIFRVYLHTDGGWQQAFASGVISGTDPPVPISVDLAGARGIILINDYAERGAVKDHANWLSARFLP